MYIYTLFIHIFYITCHFRLDIYNGYHKNSFLKFHLTNFIHRLVKRTVKKPVAEESWAAGACPAAQSKRALHWHVAHTGAATG